MLAYLWIERADRHQHLHLIRNDVAHRAAMDGTNCDYCRRQRVRLARDNCLDSEYGARRYDNWINGCLGEGSMAAAPEDCHFNRVRGSAEKSCVNSHLSGWERRLVVYPNNNLRRRKLSKYTVG